MKRYFSLLLILAATPAQAYIGPGAGLGAIGTLIAVVAALLLLVVGFVWYPVKRMMKKKKAASQDNEQS